MDGVELFIQNSFKACIEASKYIQTFVTVRNDLELYIIISVA